MYFHTLQLKMKMYKVFLKIPTVFNSQTENNDLLNLKPQQLIKGKLLLSIYSQLYVVQYGEIGG